MSRRFIIRTGQYPHLGPIAGSVGPVITGHYRIVIQEVSAPDLQLAFLQIGAHFEGGEGEPLKVVADFINAYNVRRSELDNLLYYGLRAFAMQQRPDRMNGKLVYALGETLSERDDLFKYGHYESDPDYVQKRFTRAAIGLFESEQDRFGVLLDNRNNDQYPPHLLCDWAGNRF